jgi:hypothetical protein
MFGALTFDRDPLRLQDIPYLLRDWTQTTGGFAAIALVVWVILWECGLFRKTAARAPEWLPAFFRLGLLVTLVAYGPALLMILYDAWHAVAGEVPSALETRADAFRLRFYSLSLTAGGACAILTACLPFLSNLAGQRWRRVLAIARLSFKEALRRRVLYAFVGFLLVILFGTWFIPHKPEDQVRSYVQVISWCMGPVLLFAAAILASFSIPTDIRQQTIHTIVTKPVERFEIIVGRFLGFTALMTLVLLGMTAFSLLYVFRGVDPDAAAESLKAREPLYGELRFEGTGNEHGENVGREWDYRSYITAPVRETDVRPTAVWEMPAVPAAVAARPRVNCEFGFDIFRTTKGNENKGISCNFLFITPTAKPGAAAEFARRLREALNAPGARPEAEVENELAEELGVYERKSQEVTDNHTQAIALPGGLLRAADRAARETRTPAPLHVRVTCNDRTQYVGMAKYDLYLRLDDPDAGDDRTRFALNFFKGAAGLWLRLVLVIGLAVTLSTYFSGVIALLLTLMIYVGGQFQEFIQSVAQGQNAGGGPLEAMYRLVRNENIIAPLDPTATTKFATTSDVAYRWLIGRVLNLLPDVDRFYLTPYVAEGFNIPADQLVISVLLLVLYLLPLAVLAFYLMKWREIASSS